VRDCALGVRGVRWWWCWSRVLLGETGQTWLERTIGKSGSDDGTSCEDSNSVECIDAEPLSDRDVRGRRNSSSTGLRGGEGAHCWCRDAAACAFQRLQRRPLASLAARPGLFVRLVPPGALQKREKENRIWGFVSSEGVYYCVVVEQSTFVDCEFCVWLRVLNRKDSESQAFTPYRDRCSSTPPNMRCRSFHVPAAIA
jgi:hypothetical protein